MNNLEKILNYVTDLEKENDKASLSISDCDFESREYYLGVESTLHSIKEFVSGLEPEADSQVEYLQY